MIKLAMDLNLAAAIGGDARKERGHVEADGGVRAYTIMRDVPQATLCEVLETGRERKAYRLNCPGRAATGGLPRHLRLIPGAPRRQVILLATASPTASLGYSTRVSNGVAPDLSLVGLGNRYG